MAEIIISGLLHLEVFIALKLSEQIIRERNHAWNELSQMKANEGLDFTISLSHENE
jgi:hypothetical protein